MKLIPVGIMLRRRGSSATSDLLPSNGTRKIGIPASGSDQRRTRSPSCVASDRPSGERDQPERPVDVERTGQVHPSGNGPETDHVVGRSGRECPPVGAEGHGSHGVLVLQDRPDAPSGRDVDEIYRGHLNVDDREIRPSGPSAIEAIPLGDAGTSIVRTSAPVSILRKTRPLGPP